MTRPIIENMRTWPRNLSTAQGGGLSTAQYGGMSTAQYGGMSTAQYGGMSTAQRYLDNGVNIQNIFRTDRGDDERDHGPLEWDYGRINGHRDPTGDDDIDIILQPDGIISVEYRNP